MAMGYLLWLVSFSVQSRHIGSLNRRLASYPPTRAELDALEAEGRVVFRYVGANPNGSRRDIAGIANARGNVVGLMPHPEHATEAGFGPEAHAAGGSASPDGTDGLRFFTSVLTALVAA